MGSRRWTLLRLVASVAFVLAVACSSDEMQIERTVADVPTLPELVKPVEGRTTIPTTVKANAWMAFCMKWMTGWEVDFDETPIGVITMLTDQPGFDFNVAGEVNESCSEEGEERGHIYAPTSDEEIEFYPKRVAQHECLVELEVPLTIADPPTLEEQRENPGWDPFSDIRTELLSTEEIIDAFKTCGEDRSFEVQGMEDQ